MTEEDVLAVISREDRRMAILKAVAALGLDDWWIGAGFVRNAVWDDLYHTESTPLNDVDVAYFKPLGSYGMPDDILIGRIAADEPNAVWDEETRFARELGTQMPDLEFEVKNQARMHLSKARLAPREPYASAADAIADWVETATCIGVRLDDAGNLALLACYGLSDLASGIIRPTTPAYAERARERAQAKGWLSRWPQLKFERA